MKNLKKRWYILMILCTIVALFIMTAYNYDAFKKSIQENAIDVGCSSISNISSRLDAYLSQRIEVVHTTADTIEFMMESGIAEAEIENYLVFVTEHYQEDIDENFTGIYGLFDGTYLDGAGWIPEEGYDPRTRDWYRAAAEAAGNTALVSPYVDAQTGDVMISFSELLNDGESVVSLDIKLDHIQEMTETIALGDAGYGFVVDSDGMVVAHRDSALKGEEFYAPDHVMYKVLQGAYESEHSHFTAEIEGEKYVVFTDTLMGGWKAVMLVEEEALFHEARYALMRNLLVSAGISVLIILFFSVTFVKMNQSIRAEKESISKVEEMNHKIIRALVRTIDAKDRYTNGHSLRVAEYSKEIARRMKKSEKEQETIYYAGLLHDVGKIRIPVEVINKPGKLTDEEYEQIKIHPITSYHILKDIFDDVQVKNGAKFHHERYDGAGYPNGLKKDNIPEVARIIGVADTYDAMASNRSYRKALPQEVVRAEIEKGKGKQFDPEIADIMLQMMEEDADYRMKETRSYLKKILVVDDEPMNTRMVQVIFKDSPTYEIIGAGSAKEALEILDKEAVDLILLDVMMPEIDGFEAIPKIREKSDVPIVLMTGDRHLETIEKAVSIGVEDYLTKPFQPLVLKEIVHSCLQYQKMS